MPSGPKAKALADAHAALYSLLPVDLGSALTRLARYSPQDSSELLIEYVNAAPDEIRAWWMADGGCAHSPCAVLSLALRMQRLMADKDGHGDDDDKSAYPSPVVIP